jgi:hypothetical protein
VTLLEMFAAVLLTGGSALVLWVIREADAVVGPLKAAEPAPVLRSVEEPPLRRAA